MSLKICSNLICLRDKLILNKLLLSLLVCFSVLWDIGPLLNKVRMCCYSLSGSETCSSFSVALYTKLVCVVTPCMKN